MLILHRTAISGVLWKQRPIIFAPVKHLPYYNPLTTTHYYSSQLAAIRGFKSSTCSLIQKAEPERSMTKTEENQGTGAKNSVTTSSDQSHTHTHTQEHSHDHDHKHSHSLFSHSHSHGAEDNVFLQESGGLKNPAIRITCIGLAVNIGMAIGKGVGGVVFHSQALIADSIHALSDLISDFLTLATVTVGTKPASKFFPNGYGRVETLGSLGVSVLLFFGGISMGWSGLISMLHSIIGDNSWLEMLSFVGHSHSHSHATTDPAEATNLNAAWLALGSIFIKEYLFQSTMKVAKSTGSNVLVANAWHHRIDSLVSIVAVATIGSGYLFNIQWMDSFGALIVSSIVVRAGYSTAKSATLELADSNLTLHQGGADSRFKKHKAQVVNAFQDVQNAHIEAAEFTIDDVVMMPSGPNYTTTVTLKAKPGATLDGFQSTRNYLEQRLMANKSLKRVVIILK